MAAPITPGKARLCPECEEPMVAYEIPRVELETREQVTFQCPQCGFQTDPA